MDDNLINKTLTIINKSQVAQDHFFDEINNPKWLEPLRKEGFFTKPIKEIHKDGFVRFPYWPEGGYLVRIADKAQDEVLKIINDLPDTDNERVMTNVTEALLKIDTAKAVAVTSKIKGYIKKPQYLLLGDAVGELIVKFANDGAIKEAIELARLALEVMPDTESRGKADDFTFFNPKTRYQDYKYKEMVKQITPPITANAPDKAVSMYTNLLENAVRYKEYRIKGIKDAGNDNTIEDMSLYWRPVIEESIGDADSSELRDVLITALIDSLVALVESDAITKESKAKQLRGVLGRKLQVIKRCVEYALRDKDLPDKLKDIHNDLYAEFKKIIDRPAIRSFVSNWVPEDAGITQEELEALDDNALVKKLADYEPQSPFYSDRAALGNLLKDAVKENLARYIPLIDVISSIGPLYLNSLVDAFSEAADNLSPSQIGRIAISLKPVLSVKPQEEDGETLDYHKWVRMSVARFTQKAFDKKEGKENERIEFSEADAVLDLTLVLCRDVNPTPEYESSEEGNLDPLSLSINTTRGEAMRALIYAMAWANRNRTDSKFMDRIFVELDWHLTENNDPSPAIRLIYGQYFPTIWVNRKDWAENNKNVIFSNDPLGQIAADAYVSYNNAHPDAINILGDMFRRQIPRLSREPDAKRRGVGCEGLKRLIQHLCLHYWYGAINLGDGSIMKELLDKAHPEYLSEITRFIGFGLYKSDKNNLKIKEGELKRLASLWGYLISLAEKNTGRREALKHFGVWFASGKFDNTWSLTQLLKTLNLVGSVELDFTVLERLEKLADSHPDDVIAVVDTMIDSDAHGNWGISTWRDSILSILRGAYQSGNSETQQAAGNLANKLVKKGYKEYRNTTR